MRYGPGMMVNTGRAGFYTSGAVTPEAPDDLFPQTIAGLQAWVSTTRGTFLFNDGSTTPEHGKAVAEARDVVTGAAVFNQSSGLLSPLWDTSSFDVPTMFSDGTQYLTRETSLPAPGLVIIGCAFNIGSTGFQALTGSRSTATPGGDTTEDAWHVNRHSLGQMRGLVSTTTGQSSSDSTAALHGEKILITFEANGDIRVWQVGDLGSGTISGTRIASDAQQVLFAKYYNDLIAGILQGHIMEFAQYSPAPSPEDRRALIGYFQNVVWPGISPPIAASVDAGQIASGAGTSINVVTPSSGLLPVLASIDEQPAVGTLAVAGDQVNITVPPSSAAGPYTGYYCLRSNVAGARLVNFGAVHFEVIGGAEQADLPYLGQYYGCGYHGTGAANTHMKATSDSGVSFFFFAERSGSIDRITFQRRTSNTDGYSAGDGGTYTIEIRTASATTRLPIPLSQGGAILSQVTGVRPGSSTTNASTYPVYTFSSRPGQTVANNPYCVVFRNTHTAPGSNFFSTNISVDAGYTVGGASTGSPQPSNYREPAGVDPQNPGSVPAMSAGWSPVFVNGKAWYDWPHKAINNLFAYNRMGPEHCALRYSDGQWVFFGTFPAGSIDGSTALLTTTSRMARERFRVTRASRTVSGVFIRIVRLNGTTGTLTVRLEQGPTGDAHFPGAGTLIESVSVPHTAIYNVGAEEATHEARVNVGDTLDVVPWVWVPFTQNRTLTLGTNYNLRLSVSSGFQCQMQCSGRWDSTITTLVPKGSSVATWAEWEAQRNVPWSAWEDSRGFQVSLDGGSTWAYAGGWLSPIVFKCV